MTEALSKATVRDRMDFDFRADGPFGGLTAARATQLVLHLPLTINKCGILNAGAKYGFDFWDALLERVKQFHNLSMLLIDDTSANGEAVGQEVGVRLADIISVNTTLKDLWLWKTNLIGVDNMEQLGDALMKNNTLKKLGLKGIEIEIIKQLKMKTENRTSTLEFDIRS